MKLFVALLCILALLPSAFAQTLVYAPLPMHSVRNTLANSQSLIEYLERETGLTIKFRHLDG